MKNTLWISDLLLVCEVVSNKLLVSTCFPCQGVTYTQYTHTETMRVKHVSG